MVHDIQLCTINYITLGFNHTGNRPFNNLAICLNLLRTQISQSPPGRSITSRQNNLTQNGQRKLILHEVQNQQRLFGLPFHQPQAHFAAVHRLTATCIFCIGSARPHLTNFKNEQDEKKHELGDFAPTCLIHTIQVNRVPMTNDFSAEQYSSVIM